MNLIFGSDHAGLNLRRQLVAEARALGHEVEEVGAMSTDSYDYPLASDAVACLVRNGTAEFGVLVCGSGIGVSIRANRYEGIRAALCFTPEHAALARQHNHANVLCVGERTTDPAIAVQILRTFLSTAPDDGERHVRRVEGLDGNLSC